MLASFLPQVPGLPWEGWWLPAAHSISMAPGRPRERGPRAHGSAWDTLGRRTWLGPARVTVVAAPGGAWRALSLPSPPHQSTPKILGYEQLRFSQCLSSSGQSVQPEGKYWAPLFNQIPAPKPLLMGIRVAPISELITGWGWEAVAHPWGVAINGWVAPKGEADAPRPTWTHHAG